MNDEFLRALQAVWQSQPHDPELAMRRLHRTRWIPHLTLVAQALGCAGALWVGVWFIQVAASNPQNKLLFSASAAVMLISVPAWLIVSIAIRWSSFAWHAETPETLMRTGMRRAEASLRALRLAHWHVAVVCGFVALLWAFEGFGWIQAADFLVPYSLICLLVSILYSSWVVWRRRQLRAEHDAYAQVLTSLQLKE